jgi:hypothetical protein
MSSQQTPAENYRSFVLYLLGWAQELKEVRDWREKDVEGHVYGFSHRLMVHLIAVDGIISPEEANHCWTSTAVRESTG